MKNPLNEVHLVDDSPDKVKPLASFSLFSMFF